MKNGFILTFAQSIVDGPILMTYVQVAHQEKQ